MKTRSLILLTALFVIGCDTFPDGVVLDEVEWEADPNPINCGESGVVRVTAKFTLDNTMAESNYGVRAVLWDSDVFLWNVHVSDSNELHSLVKPSSTRSVTKVFHIPVECGADDCDLKGSVNDSDENDPDMFIELTDPTMEKNYYRTGNKEVACVEAEEEEEGSESGSE